MIWMMANKSKNKIFLISSKCILTADNYYQGSDEKDATDPPPIRSEDIIKTSTGKQTSK